MIAVRNSKDLIPMQAGIVSTPRVATGIRRGLYLASGFASLLLAVLGAMLPVLPTTPFLLLASFFFVRSSPRLHRRLLKSPVFGRLIRDWHTYRAVPRHVKSAALTMVVCSMFAGIAFGRLSVPLQVVLLVAGSTGFCVVLRLPVIERRIAEPSGQTIAGTHF